MANSLTLTLPDEVFERVRRLAQRTGQDTNAVAAMMLGLSLMEMDTRPVESLTDAEVLALADSMMDTEQNAHFSALQDKQQAGIITDSERVQLKILLEIYHAGQLRKTQALVEAVKRGLRERLDV